MAHLKLLSEALIPATLCLLFLQSSCTPAVPTLPSSRGCIAGERAALLIFKAGLIDPDNNLSSWQGQDCCRWWGIRCSNRTGHVVELSASFGHLGGETSSSLLALKNLRYLDLSYNNFNSTPIPEFIGSLKNLRHLDLSIANFGGQIPPHLGNLSKLSYLDLTSFDYPQLHTSDLAWLTRLSMLKYLVLGGVNLSSVIDWAHAVNMLPSLVTLHLGGTGLPDVIPRLSHINLTLLESMDLSFNWFNLSLGAKHLFRFFSDLPSLQTFDLSACGLQGPIPEVVGNMSSLRELILGFNNLQGPIPEVVGNMSSLRELRLAGNNLTTVPSTFKNLRNLEVLDMTSSLLSGDIAVLMGSLPCGILQSLDLSFNHLVGSLPDRLEHLSNLTSLDVSYNMITGEIPPGIGALTKLEELYLVSNNLDGTIREYHFAKLASLKYLDIFGNSLTMVVDDNWVPPFKLLRADLKSCKLGPKFPKWLKTQDSIDMLDISNTSIVDSIPRWFWTTFSKASFLYLSTNQISGTLPSAMLEDIWSLDLSRNSLSGPLPSNFRAPMLRSLDLSRNSLSGPLPSNFGVPMLAELILSENSFTGRIPRSFCLLQNYSYVDMSRNRLKGAFPDCWEVSKAENSTSNSFNESTASNIIILNLNDNKLSGAFPSFIQKCNQLNFLNLANNLFSGSVPTWIGEKLPSLKFLILRSNMFSGHIPCQLTKMKQLQYLDLACNNFSGSIPQSLMNLTAMTLTPHNSSSSIPSDTFMVMKGQLLEFTWEIMYMVNFDLSCNNLIGYIPEEIGMLVTLKNLNLSWNHLNGIIPESIGDLRALESLDLSHNELSGEIPTNLSVLTSLSHLNLSYNNLSGKIPSGNQLRTLDDQSSIYMGNPGLCGPPLSKNCSETGLTPSAPEKHEARSDVVFFYLGMGIGYVLGIWIVFCTFLFKRKWRMTCFSCVDHLYDWVYVQVAVSWISLRRKMGRS